MVEKISRQEKIEKIEKALEEKGEDWVVAAMVEGSIGYHTPKHARLLIKRFREGEEKDFCERCIALFNCDLIDMMYYDITRFEWLEERDPEKVRRLLEFVKKVEKLDDMDQIAVSLAYPTMNI